MSISETETASEPRTPSAPAAPAAQIADPGPLGLAGFAATTFALSAVNAGLLPKSIEPVVLPLALFYGGLAQLLAGMWEFRKNNTFGATAFTSYGAFWLSFALFEWQFASEVPEADATKAIGLLLLVFTIFTAYMAIASLRTNAALVGVFAVLLLTFMTLTVAEFTGVHSLATLGGGLGLLTAVLAWYASFASVLNATFATTVLPVKPLAR